MAPSSVLSSVLPSPMLLSRTVILNWVSVEPWTRGKNWFQTRPWTRTRWIVTFGAITLIDPVTSMSWMTAFGVSISRSPWWTDFGVQPAGVPVLPGVGNCWPTAGGRPVGPLAATDVKFCPPAVPPGAVPRHGDHGQRHQGADDHEPDQQAASGQRFQRGHVPATARALVFIPQPPF